MRPTAAVLAASLLAACGDDPAGGVDAPPGVDASTPAAFDDGIARIDVQSATFSGGQGATSISAMLLDTPAPWPYEPAVTEGSCRMFRKLAADACQPLCDFDQICDGNTCVDFPVSASSGTLTVSGDGRREDVAFDMGYGRYLQTALWAAGTELTASAPGADFPAFTVSARLPPTFTVRNAQDLRLAMGVPLTLQWDPAGDGSRVRVNLGADYGHGRHRSVVVECDVADADGGVTVPQSMVDVLADRANWSCGDCFSQDVRRYHRGDAAPGATSLTLWAVQVDSLYLVPDGGP